MARIRTVKPEFWTSEQILALRRDTRLFFIGLWNFCDDGGVHPFSPKNLTTKVFPEDEDIGSESVRGMLCELAVAGLIEIFNAEDGKLFLRVTGWKHQRIEHPSYRYPRKGTPLSRKQLHEFTLNPQRSFLEPSPPEGRKEGGREGSKDPSPPTTTDRPSPGPVAQDQARPSDLPDYVDAHGATDRHGRVCVHYPDPAKPERLLWISPNGSVDYIDRIRDLDHFATTADNALDLRARALGLNVHPLPLQPEETRVPPDWTPTQDTLRKALDRGYPPSQIDLILPDYIAFWARRSGPAGRKTDWQSPFLDFLRQYEPDNPQTADHA